MNRLITTVLLSLLLAVAACSVVQDEVEALRSEVTDLQTRVKGLNGDLSGLKTIIEEIRTGGYATSTEILSEDGVERLSITFNDGRSVVIGSGRIGVDGVTDGCLVGVAAEEGVWYWTLNGEWLTDEAGERRIAVGRDGYIGITPLLKIEDGNWQLSVDGGNQWEEIAPVKGEDGFFVIASADLSSESMVVLTLADGQQISVPRSKAAAISFNIPSEGRTICAGETVEIPFTIEGTPTDSMMLVAGGDGRYQVLLLREAADSGVLKVTCPEVYSDGYVYLIGDNLEGYTTLSVIEFYERTVDWLDGREFQVAAEGGELNIPYVSTFEGFFSITDRDAVWLHAASAEMTPDLMGFLSLQIDPNGTDEVRTATVELHPKDNPSYVFTTLTIIQETKKN